MHFNRYKDVLLHVLLPLAGGLFIYLSGSFFPWPSLLKNYLPDACWSYALFSSVLLAWDRTLQIFWLIAAGTLLLSIEWLQGAGYLPGTEDAMDLVVYGAAAALALGVNQLLVLSSENRSKI